MFEKFPQLKRLERLLSKTQAFSPKKGKGTTQSRKFVEDTSPSTQTVTSRDTNQKSCYLDTFDSVAESCHPVEVKRQTAAAAATVKNLYDSDDLLEFKNPEDASNRQTVKKTPIERKRTWTNTMCSPRDLLRSRTTQNSQFTPKMGPLSQKAKNSAVHSSVGKRALRRAILRPMQEQPSSDALCVLSDEECEDDESLDDGYPKNVRYPLPTMPLSIMVPVGHLPDCVTPVDTESVLSKISQFDNNIDTLMDARGRLATTYTLFDDLCTTFRGPENLNQFLRSLVDPHGGRATPEVEHLHATSVPRSQSVAKQIRREQFPSSMPPAEFGASVGRTCTVSPLSTESRLCRPTVSTRMKQVDPAAYRSKNILSPCSSTDSAVSTTARSSVGKHYNSANTDRKINRKTNRSCTPAATHVSEEDAKEDMMLRVRRGLMNLPWIGRAARDHFCRSSPCPTDACTWSTRSPLDASM